MKRKRESLRACTRASRNSSYRMGAIVPPRERATWVRTPCGRMVDDPPIGVGVDGGVFQSSGGVPMPPILEISPERSARARDLLGSCAVLL